MTIGVDLDEVLADSLSTIIEYHNALYNTALTRDQFHSYNFWEVWGGTKDEAIQKIYDFFASPLVKQIKPVAGAQLGITSLKTNHDLIVITSRTHDREALTYNWLNQHFPNCFKDVRFTNHFTQSGLSIPKAKVCDDLQVDAFIDDIVQYATECLKPNRKILLFNKPWNKNAELPAGIQRVYTWTEIEKYLNSA